MVKRSTTGPTNESRMSNLHKEHLRDAVDAVHALLNDGTMSPTAIKSAYDKVFKKGRFPELKGKMDPRFDTTVYPRLPDLYFGKEMAAASETEMHWKDAKELADLAARGSPLTRLLAAYIWKRGELGRVKQLLSGINDTEERKTVEPMDGTKDQERDDDGPAVMWQFGRHLVNREINPICDQHTFRAFVILERVQRGAGLDFNQDKYATLRQDQIETYISWWKKIVSNKAFPQEEPERTESIYFIDQLLFSLGKAARPPRRQKGK